MSEQGKRHEKIVLCDHGKKGWITASNNELWVT